MPRIPLRIHSSVLYVSVSVLAITSSFVIFGGDQLCRLTHHIAREQILIHHVCMEL